MLSKNKDFENVSSQIVDMIVGSTLKKHGVKLDPDKIDPKEKEELRKIVNNLQESVDAFTKKKDKEKED
ncbi:hypothetical protein [Halobacillus amylolyticus]|uniref:Spore coat protein n=1 Tax=Halobacillus amylolyticus TaxID=2932259 RepID=A0ABY4HEG7_9BACI|nr:hypothetical protein [Halobacillus amylolyticus]UOR13109.1 hypothetical protein MUO15_06360 [Halobacillus amylolyticus]